MTHEPGTAEDSVDLPPLAGFRVVDLTQVIAGPYATLMLADLGAEVLKIERPGHGDDLRSVGRYPGRDGHEDYFYANNRSKKSVTLDLKDPNDRAVGQDLARAAHVVVENFSPGTAHRLGMGWEDLQPLNPKLIYCSLSGFGQTGPSRDRYALDPMIQAITGLMTVNGMPDDPPAMVGAPLSDVMAGMFAAFSVVSALHAVGRSGQGRHIDVSMQDATLSALGPRMGEPLQAGSIRDGTETESVTGPRQHLQDERRYLPLTDRSERPALAPILSGHGSRRPEGRSRLRQWRRPRRRA